MALEIERRFKIKFLPNLDMVERKEITQDYLYKDSFTACRKRKIVDNESTKFIYTCKCKAGTEKGSTNEIEAEISKEKYDSLGNGYGNTIVKDRYIYNLENGLVAEIDIFKGKFEKIAIVEVEFESIEQAKKFVIPEWFGDEICDKLDCGIKWSNLNLAKMTDSEIEKVKKELELK